MDLNAPLDPIDSAQLAMEEALVTSKRDIKFLELQEELMHNVLVRALARLKILHEDVTDLCILAQIDKEEVALVAKATTDNPGWGGLAKIIADKKKQFRETSEQDLEKELDRLKKKAAAKSAQPIGGASSS